MSSNCTKIEWCVTSAVAYVSSRYGTCVDYSRAENMAYTQTHTFIDSECGPSFLGITQIS